MLKGEKTVEKRDSFSGEKLGANVGGMGCVGGRKMPHPHPSPRNPGLCGLHNKEGFAGGALPGIWG